MADTYSHYIFVGYSKEGNFRKEITETENEGKGKGDPIYQEVDVNQWIDF